MCDVLNSKAKFLVGTISTYEKRREIGRGTYGTVYDGIEVTSQRHVAIKKVIATLHAAQAEASLLRRLSAPLRSNSNPSEKTGFEADDDGDYVVQLLDVVNTKNKVYLVLEYMDTDLETIIQAPVKFPIPQVKAYLLMLLRGVATLHRNDIIHRDLKPNNLLVSTTQRRAKIADLGMATTMRNSQIDQKRSLQVVTRAYRAPELFFGDDKYDFTVDTWSIGCIFAEMLLRRPYFDGASDLDQLSKIFSALGSPAENGWEQAETLPFFMRFKDMHPTPLADQFPDLSALGVDLISKLLKLDPKKRISVDDALNHPFWCEDPLPATADELVVVERPSTTKKRAFDEILSIDAISIPSIDGANGLAVKGRRIL